MNNLFSQLLHSREKMERQASEGLHCVKASEIVAHASFVYYDIARDLGLSDAEAIIIAGHRVPDEIAASAATVKIEANT